MADVLEGERASWGSRGVWPVRSVAIRAPHPAAFPQELARRVLWLFCRPGGLVVDFLAGSGTTCAVEGELGMCWLGVSVRRDTCAFPGSGWRRDRAASEFEQPAQPVHEPDGFRCFVVEVSRLGGQPDVARFFARCKPGV